MSKKFNLSNDRERISYINEAVKEIAKLQNPVEQDLYIDKLAKEQNISKDALKVNLMRERRKNRRANRNKGRYGQDFADDSGFDDQSITSEAEKYDIAQTRLLFLFLKSEDARKYILSQRFLFPDKNYAQVAELWLKYIETHEKYTVNDFLDFIPEALQGIIVNAEMKNMPEDFSIREIDETIKFLQGRRIDSQLNELKAKIQDAERRKDKKVVMEITLKILELKRLKG